VVFSGVNLGSGLQLFAGLSAETQYFVIAPD
jgi:hypothetical protein